MEAGVPSLRCQAAPMLDGGGVLVFTVLVAVLGNLEAGYGRTKGEVFFDFKTRRLHCDSVVD